MDTNQISAFYKVSEKMALPQSDVDFAQIAAHLTSVGHVRLDDTMLLIDRNYFFVTDENPEGAFVISFRPDDDDNILAASATADSAGIKEAIEWAMA